MVYTVERLLLQTIHVLNKVILQFLGLKSAVYNQERVILTRVLYLYAFDSDSFVFPQYLHNKKRNDKNIKSGRGGVCYDQIFPFFIYRVQTIASPPKSIIFFPYFFLFVMIWNKTNLRYDGLKIDPS